MTWLDDAACRGKDTRLFFDDLPQLAKSICADCTVRVECREAGAEEPFGTWGGLSAAERFGGAAWKPRKIVGCHDCGCAIPARFRLCDGCRVEHRRQANRAQHLRVVS